MTASVSAPASAPAEGATTAPRRLPPAVVSAGVMLAGLLLGLALGMAHYVLQPPKYNATTLVNVVPAPGRTSGQTGLETLAQIRYGQALARLAVMPQVAGPQLRAAGLEDLAASPNKTITVSAAPDTAIFSVTAQDTDAHRAKAAADAVAQAAVALCVTDQMPVRAVTNPAPLPTTPVPGRTVRLVLGACVGLALAALLLLVRADRRNNL